MIDPERVWSSSPVPSSPEGLTDVRLFKSHIVGVLGETHWFCLDTATGNLLWQKKRMGRPNTVKGLYGDVIVATEFRCHDSPILANYGVYGISLETQKILWTSHAPGRWGRFLRLLDFVPDFTNEFREAPVLVRGNEVVTDRGRTLDATTGETTGNLEVTEKMRMSSHRPTVNFRWKKHLDYGELGTLHTGTPEEPDDLRSFDDSKPLRFYLKDRSGDVLWTFDTSKINDIFAPKLYGQSLEVLTPYIYLLVSDQPRYADPVPGEWFMPNPAHFVIWTLDMRSGKIVQKVPVNHEPITKCEIQDSTNTHLLLSHGNLETSHCTLLYYAIANGK